MKYKFTFLVITICIIDSSNSCLAFPAPMNSLRTGPAVIESDAVNEGVAAIVDDEVVTYLEVQQQFATTEKVLRENYQGEKLDTLIKNAKLDALNTLIDRRLIIHDFKQRLAGVMPDKYVEERINDSILHEFSGNKKQFAQALADRGTTLDEYKKEINDDAIVGYMNGLNVAEKVKALNPANPDEEKKLTESTRKAWLDSLRQQAYIKNFYEPTAH